MFGKLLKQKDTQKNSKAVANRLYACALSNTRKEEFYTKAGIPDTFDGRFDLLLLNIFLILRGYMGQAEYESVSQGLFDEVFKDMDQVLREMGIGDMGIPKHQRRMMKAFNGRMHAYQLAIDPDSLNDLDLQDIKPADLNQALRRNLYGTVENISDLCVAMMEKFVRDNLDGISITHEGDVIFCELKAGDIA